MRIQRRGRAQQLAGLRSDVLDLDVAIGAVGGAAIIRQGRISVADQVDAVTGRDVDAAVRLLGDANANDFRQRSHRHIALVEQGRRRVASRGGGLYLLIELIDLLDQGIGARNGAVDLAVNLGLQGGNGNQLADGTYKLTATATASDGSAVTTSVASAGTVTQIDMSGSTPQLVIGNMEVQLSDIAAVAN